MKQTATAIWMGPIKGGSGHLTTRSAALDKTPFSFSSRFADGAGTNPEELMAAAHAACFTMKLSLNLTLAGFTPDLLDTECDITVEDGVITHSHLSVKAKVAGLAPEQLLEYASEAKANCPVSNAYHLEISLYAELV